VPERGGRRPGRVTRGLALVAGLLALGSAALVWPRDDVPREPHAIVVLGGVGAERVELGMALSDRFRVPLVLSASAWGFGYNVGLRCGEDGVICLRPATSSTRGEAVAITELTEREGWDRIAVATSDFHTARARVLFRQCLGERVVVVGARPHRRRGAVTYAREVVGTLAAHTIRRAC
jgi:hypothetical protein